jgi:hypothetical protein
MSLIEMFVEQAGLAGLLEQKPKCASACAGAPTSAQAGQSTPSRHGQTTSAVGGHRHVHQPRRIQIEIQNPNLVIKDSMPRSIRCDRVRPDVFL